VRASPAAKTRSPPAAGATRAACQAAGRLHKKQERHIRRLPVYWSMCGPDGTLLRAGLAWVFIGPYGPCSRNSTEHLMGDSRGPDLVGPGRLTCYAIGTTASAEPRGILLPAHHWDGSPGKIIRHSTRRATRPFGGAGPRSGSVRWRTRKRTTAGGVQADHAEQWTRDAILQRVVQTRPFESLGLRPARERCCGSNNVATVFV
jgi:hypothetical protein